MRGCIASALLPTQGQGLTVMRLTAIRVTNHSRLADLSLEVRAHLVLVGPNDVGKSSLLRCLDLLLAASVASLWSWLPRGAGRPKPSVFA